MAKKDVETFTVEGAQIIFRNFKGKEGQYNREGDRSFAVILDPDAAEALASVGWNVKTLNPREEGDDPVPYISVSVSYKNRAPNVVLITSTSRTRLDEDTVELLDVSDFENVDLIARAYDWEVNGKTGKKAYLQTMFATLAEDELERKYAQVADE